MKRCENFIDGKFVPSDQEGQRISVFNPATEAEITQVPESSPAEVDRAVKAAMHAQKNWAKLAAVERGKYLRQVAAKIRDRTDFFGYANVCISAGIGSTSAVRMPARVAAIVSIAETCRRLKIPVRDYLGSVLPGLSDFPIDRIAELTPSARAANAATQNTAAT